MFRLRRIYNGTRDINVAHVRAAECARLEARCVDALYSVVPQLARIVRQYERGLVNLIDDIRRAKDEEFVVDANELEGLNNMSAEDVDVLRTSYDLLCRLIAIARIRANTANLVSQIEIECARQVDAVAAPAPVARLAAADARTAAVIRVSDDDWA